MGLALAYRVWHGALALVSMAAATWVLQGGGSDAVPTRSSKALVCGYSLLCVCSLSFGFTIRRSHTKMRSSHCVGMFVIGRRASATGWLP